MTAVTIYKDASGGYAGFSCEGHAGYAVAGSDVVCAAVSVLVINTLNAIESLTDTPVSARADEDAGKIDAAFPDGCGHDAGLLMDAMAMGLQGIRGNYGEYLKVDIKEG